MTNYKNWKSLDLFPYQTDPVETIGECVRWMMAIDGLIEKIGMNMLDALLKEGNPVNNRLLFRKYLFE